MSWHLDPRFRTTENRSILAFIERENPSAHDEVASILIRSAEGLPDVQWYCPDKWRYAYVVLHTRRQRIFGIAFGMNGLAFLLPSSMHPEALAAGGTVCSAIGDAWIEWHRATPLDTTRWCKAAHDDALRAEAKST